MSYLNRLFKDSNTGLIYKLTDMETVGFEVECEFRLINDYSEGLIEEYDNRDMTFEDMLKLNDLELVDEV